MPLIPGEVLARAFLTKFLISPSFKDESLNLFSGGVGGIGFIRMPQRSVDEWVGVFFSEGVLPSSLSVY